MLENNDLLPEEQAHPELQQDLQAIYQWKPEEKQAYQRVRERLMQNTQPIPAPEPVQLPSQQNRPASDSLTSPIRNKHQRWIQRINTYAAVFFVAALVGALALTFWSIPHSRTHVGTSPSSDKVRTPILLYEGVRLAMITDQIGWAMGDQVKNPFSTVLHTTDGGKHWQDVTPSGAKQLGEIYVLDEEMAWVPLYEHSDLPNAVALTIDGGKTWQHYQCPNKYPCAVDYVDHDHAWLTYQPSDTTSESGGVLTGSSTPLVSTQPTQATKQAKKPVLYHTSNGGKTWQPVGDLPPSVLSLQFINDQTGWLETMEFSQQDHAPVWRLYITHDGGHSWKEQMLPKAKGIKSLGYMSLPVFTTKDDGYLFAGKALNQQEYVYTTQDGGNSWQINSNALPAYVFTRQVIDQKHIIGNALDNRNSSTVGVGDIIMLTLVNGQWTQTRYPLPSKVHLIDECFISTEEGIIIVDTAGHTFDVFKTTNGGKTWQKIGSLIKGT
ncbi:hypothetical protein KSF_100220 [Reticulibacter mediterranei]|uniref:Photosynthesis system II assembly factor Ycf48/Hcf136-like domain-containing protein n=1 Tax=Reticulibacter mediterranei TaxID=2778369 RepID=A0A8J3IQ99_9CHLR|nr:hypothetical protein [Reticulibacter mediterranei]GHO99974.1 hypothetical protein KSF_100220 [Reticulibacter mediterranei]